jgi:hypothetical protein
MHLFTGISTPAIDLSLKMNIRILQAQGFYSA